MRGGAIRGGAISGGRGGFLLPLMILGLLALTALAMMSFVLALGMVRDTTLERRYIRGWVAPEAVDTVEVAVGWDLVRLAGPSLVDTAAARAGDGDGSVTDAGRVGRSTYRVERVIDPPREAQRWSVPVYTPLLVTPADAPPPAWAADACGGGEAGTAAAAGPLLRLFEGLVGVLAPSGIRWVEEATLGDMVASGTSLAVVPEPSDGGVGPAWLFSAGDLVIRGGTGRGILLARGSVTLADGARWEGGLAAEGIVEIQAGGELVGDRCAIESTLAFLPPPRRIPFEGSGPLGRY